MSDRYSSLTVVMEKDIREDDATAIMDAIRMLKGVIGVSGNVTQPDNYMAETRAKNELRKKLLRVVWED
ncbi:hypothetical protein MHK_005318 [Candidatus Magnetomorum sp. HK-1]|nr:hypothetical protein MHK_005318 [Candidatus Magnetomorum sp. HK-1]